MQAYTGFAQVYDIFMDNVPYDEWTEYVTSLLKEHGVSSGLVLELGCGTGNVTRRLADQGYDMIGIDYSEEMLEIAREQELNNCYEVNDELDEYDIELHNNDEKDSNEYEKDSNEYEEYEDGYLENNENYEEYQNANSTVDDELDIVVDSGVSRILYLQQDMRSFELFGTVAAVVSICDSMNYITSEEDLLQVFKLVNNYLDPSGIFIFDMNTEYKYKHILADNIIAENRDDCSFIWENYYYEDKQINEYNMTIFVKLEEDNSDDDDFVNNEDLSMEYEKSVNEDIENDDRPINLFERFKEIHYQKAYSIDLVKKLLEDAGMEFIAVYDAFTHNPPTNTSERVYFIAKEKFQENKKYL